LELLTNLELDKNALTGTHSYPLHSSSFFLFFFFDVAFIIIASTSSFILFNSAGTMPYGVCSQLQFLENAVVDCYDVVCWCCEGCIIDLWDAIEAFDAP
jgi:hypothetical protein